MKKTKKVKNIFSVVSVLVAVVIGWFTDGMSGVMNLIGFPPDKKSDKGNDII